MASERKMAELSGLNIKMSAGDLPSRSLIERVAEKLNGSLQPEPDVLTYGINLQSQAQIPQVSKRTKVRKGSVVFH
jgi:hypothetical protein